MSKLKKKFKNLSYDFSIVGDVVYCVFYGVAFVFGFGLIIAGGVIECKDAYNQIKYIKENVKQIHNNSNSVAKNQECITMKKQIQDTIKAKQK